MISLDGLNGSLECRTFGDRAELSRSRVVKTVESADRLKIFKKLQLRVASWIFAVYSFNCKAPQRSEQEGEME